MGYNQKISSNWTCSSSFWTREEDKAFENALAIYYDTSNLWQKIAAAVPGKTREEIKDHFQVLIADVNAIESGLVPLPRYTDSSKKSRKRVGHAALDKKGKQAEKNQSESGCSGKSSRSDSDRKRGKLWSKEEHMLFLQGLEKYGRGDWRSISRHFVRSRTPPQVASHAQKYFKRMDVANKDRTRPSIHDVTILDDGKIVTQRVVGSCYMDTGSKPSGNTVGDGVLYSSLLDCHCNISLHVPTNEGMSGAVDFVESLLECPDDVSTPEEPSSQQITKPAGVTPLLATQNISTPKVMIASADADFCDSLFAIQHDISNSKGSMTEQVTGTAEGAHVLKFGESSLPVHPDFGVHAPPTASRPTLEPFSSDVQILGWFPSLESDASFIRNFPDDMATSTYKIPPSGQK